MATRTIAIVSTGRPATRRYRRASSPVVLTLQRIRQDRLLIYDKKLDERPGGKFRCNQLSHAHINLYTSDKSIIRSIDCASILKPCSIVIIHYHRRAPNSSSLYGVAKPATAATATQQQLVNETRVEVGFVASARGGVLYTKNIYIYHYMYRMQSERREDEARRVGDSRRIVAAAVAARRVCVSVPRRAFVYHWSTHTHTYTYMGKVHFYLLLDCVATCSLLPPPLPQLL
ncbi:unnamed protein product [Trichogramma brassicae]|uniref:Uncharacterized protein n=1 Tax=Trichogramma brassicae TaxID=86971 RepID=A0A6H5ITV5_9HYME|nr:unnamed protein product [Trichogramma brassicae]